VRCRSTIFLTFVSQRLDGVADHSDEHIFGCLLVVITLW
jgi:hypothetical protein